MKEFTDVKEANQTKISRKQGEGSEIRQTTTRRRAESDYSPEFATNSKIRFQS